MDLNNWMDRYDDVYRIMRDIPTADRILKQLDIQEDFIFLIRNSAFKKDKFIDIVNILLKEDKLDVIEDNIKHIDSSFWPYFLTNDKFKKIFLENVEEVLKSGFDYSDISLLLDDENAQEFFTNNAELICTKIKGGISNFIIDLTNKTEYGEEILIEYQSELFKDKMGMKYTIIHLREKGIDIDKYLTGIIENLSMSLNDNCTILNEIKLVLEESKLPKEQIDEIKEKAVNMIISKGRIKKSINMQITEFNDVDMIKTLWDLGIDKSVMENMSQEWLNNINGTELIRYVKILREINCLPQDYNINRLVQSMFKDDYEDPQTFYMIERLIIEIAENQNIDPLDIEDGGSGRYSQNIKIGEYILKIGEERNTNQIPYHRRLNQPLIRQESDPEYSKKSDGVFIEIQNYVDVKWYKGMSEYEIKEELYKIYKELRDDGIIWTDVKEENVGRLLKPNEPIFIQGGQVLGRNSVSTQMIDIKDEEPLEVGQLVIIDTDFIYRQDDICKNYLEANYSYHREFQERYKEEKSKENIENNENRNIVSKSALDFNESLKIVSPDTTHTTTYYTDDTRIKDQNIELE